jgi:hypothetical protein
MELAETCVQCGFSGIVVLSSGSATTVFVNGQHYSDLTVCS